MTIVTPEQIETIDKYINEQNFSKKDTGQEVKDLFTVLITYGMSITLAMRNVECIVNAIRYEYGQG